MIRKKENILSPSIVYLIYDSFQDLYKIGVTRTLSEKRLKQLQTGNGTKLIVLKQHETFYPFRVESFLHNKFSLKREIGEWFRLEEKDVKDFNEICQKYEEIIKSLKNNIFFSKNLR